LDYVSYLKQAEITEQPESTEQPEQAEVTEQESWISSWSTQKRVQAGR
jgi:hypothetical protein